MQRFHGQIQWYRLLEQWSTEIRKSSHRKQIKAGFDASIKTSDFYTQIINHYFWRNAWDHKSQTGR
jgi:hypothetical protein